MGNFWSTEGAGPLEGIVGSPPFKGGDQDFEMPVHTKLFVFYMQIVCSRKCANLKVHQISF